MIARFNGNVVPFADDATSTNRTVFGGVTQSDAIDDNLNADFKKGWEIVGLNDNPTREDFNAMGYTLGALISYLYEMGISEWNTSQNYRANSRVTGSDGKIYKSLTGTTGTPNVGNNPTSDAVNWQVENVTDYSILANKATPVDADLLALGDSTSSFRLKKLTWANLKATLKAYFDTLYMSLSENQTISGIKYFTSKILSPNLSYKDTPVTITSWSYAATTITLNVTSHTFVAGDYIEVSGLTATTYPANGIQLVTSVTSTTIVFTLGATPTGTTGVSSATVKGYATINNRISESIGINQTWKSVTASRISESTYTNTAGKPIMVIISNSAEGGSNGIVYIDGRIILGITEGVDSNQSFGFIVPMNSTYSVSMSNIAFWSELR